MMSRSTRSSLFALVTAGLLTLGATGCFSQDAADVEPFDAEAQSAENDSAEGVTTTLAGELTYLAPHEYLVENQAFHVDDVTQIFCGNNISPTQGADESGYATQPCAEVELEAALQEGTVVYAEVVIVDGVAESITEY